MNMRARIVGDGDLPENWPAAGAPEETEEAAEPENHAAAALAAIMSGYRDARARIISGLPLAEPRQDRPVRHRPAPVPPATDPRQRRRPEGLVQSILASVMPSSR